MSKRIFETKKNPEKMNKNYRILRHAGNKKEKILLNYIGAENQPTSIKQVRKYFEK